MFGLGQCLLREEVSQQTLPIELEHVALQQITQRKQVSYDCCLTMGIRFPIGLNIVILTIINNKASYMI
jgi:hypothetical protein